MSKLELFRSSVRGLIASLLVPVALGFAHGQTTYPEQKAEVHDLPALTANSTQASDVLRTSLQTVLHNDEVCCGKDSAFSDALERVDPDSLKDIAAKLEGNHLLSDGRTVTITTEYLKPNEVTAGHLVAMIQNQHPALMMWNSHLYVVCGVTYLVEADNDYAELAYTTHKFLLRDVRYSDSRREVVFDRVTEDASQVQGLLFLEWKMQ